MASAAITERPIRADLNGRPRPVTIEWLISKHIRADVTALFRELERQSAHTSLHAKAKRLSAPFLDFEAAARAAGWEQYASSGGYFSNPKLKSPHNIHPHGQCWKALCVDTRIEPHEIPVIGHYIVTAELADELDARGERVERGFGGNIVWARRGVRANGPVPCVIELPLTRDPVLLAICAAEAI